MLLLTAVALFVLEFPGRRTGFTTYAHGWPFTYLDRDYRSLPLFVTPAGYIPEIGGVFHHVGTDPVEAAREMQKEWSGHGFPLKLEQEMTPWTTNGTVEFRPIACAADTVVVAILLAGLAWVVERRRLAANRRLQFRLRTLLVGIAVLSVVFGTIASWHRRYQAEQRAIADWARIGGRVDGKFWRPPVWMPESLLKLDRSFGELFDRAATVSIDNVTDDAARCLAGFAEVTHVDGFVRSSSGLMSTHSGLAALAKVRTLKVLDLNSVPLTDADLEQLAALPNLSELTALDCWRITAAGIRQLQRSSRLKSLSFEGINSNDELIAALRDLPCLDKLYLRGHAAGRVEVAGFRHLRRLSLLAELTPETKPPEHDWFERPVVVVRDLPELEDLTILGATAEEGTFRAIDAMPSLKALNVGFVDLKGTDRIALRGCKNLQKLELGDLQGAEIRVSDMPQLESIALYHAPQLALLELRNMPNLRELDLSGRDRNQGIEINSPPAPVALTLRGLAGLPKLETLLIPRKKLDAAAMADLGKLTALKSLDLSRSGPTDTDLANCKRLLNLEELDLASTPIKNAALASLKSLTNLHGLSLDRTQVSDGGLATLAELPSLEVLSLIDTTVSDAGIFALARISSLRTLYVGGSKITAAGQKQLEMALPQTKIDTVRWNNNAFPPVGSQRTN